MPRSCRTLLAALVTAAVASAACSGGDGPGEVAATTVAPSTTVAATVSEPTMPLTGLPFDPAKAGRPALIVKIDNAPKGRPQAGINQADVVVEEMVEGGVTRLAAIFHSQDAGLVGPVRSFRTTDLAIAGALNRPLLAYSGANADFEAKLRASPVVNAGPSAVGGAYRRVRGRPAPYNFFADFAGLYGLADRAGGPPPPLFSYRGAVQPAAGEPASGVAMEYRGRVLTAVEWSYDAASDTWRRVQNGTPHVDDTGAPVAPRNVVVQFVEYIDTGYRDQSGEPVPEAEMIGEGEAWVLTQGRVVKARWHKASADAPTTYLDASGAIVALTPGQTWLELPRPGTAQLR